jgi:hypothetical protein
VRLILLPFAAAAVTLTVAAAAFAGDPVAAEALFREGRAAAKRGDHATACAKFAESHRLDPAPGTLLNLGDCKAQLGLLASAWQYYREAADRLAGDPRAAMARKRAAEIEPRLSRLTLELAPGAPGDTRVARDDVTLGDASLGVALPVDPGEHRINVRAPGREDRHYRVSLAEAESKTLAVEPGPPAKRAPAPPRADTPPAGNTTPPGKETPAEAPSGISRPLGFVVLGLGVAGVAAGAVTGIMTIDRKNTVEADCPGGVCATSAGLDAASEGKTLSLVSTIAFAAGAAGLGLGTYLIIAGGSPAQTTTALALTTSARGAGFGVFQSF